MNHEHPLRFDLAGVDFLGRFARIEEKEWSA